jgi:hypothetical protein
LRERLDKRATDSAQVIDARMARAESEVSHWDGYDYVLVNDDVEECFESVHTILKAERLRRSRQTGLIGFIRGLNKKSDGAAPGAGRYSRPFAIQVRSIARHLANGKSHQGHTDAHVPTANGPCGNSQRSGPEAPCVPVAPTLSKSGRRAAAPRSQQTKSYIARGDQASIANPCGQREAAMTVGAQQLFRLAGCAVSSGCRLTRSGFFVG